MRLSSGRGRFLIAVLAAVVVAGGVAGVLYLRDAPQDAPEAQEGADAAVARADQSGADSGTGGKVKDAGKDGDAKKDSAIPVNVAAIHKGTVSSYITSTANLVSENEVSVLAEADGRVADLLVEEGDRVRKGQVLAQLVREDAEIALRKAQLREANARLAWERGTKTLDAELLSREDYDKLEMEHEVARQERAEAEWRLEKTTIRAPFTGRITQRRVLLGQHVRPADHLFTIADFDPLIARIFLPERDVYGLDEGRAVRITMKANTDISFAGRIRQISPVVDTATGTVKVTIDAVDPPASVRSGAFVTVDIVRETRQTAILVPREAVIRELQDAYVFVVREKAPKKEDAPAKAAAKADGKDTAGQDAKPAEGPKQAVTVAEKRSVTLGLEEGEVIEALAGLEPGDQVVVAGQGGLKDGAEIRVIPSIEASDLTLARRRPDRG